jgi:hypothetical protein
MVALGSCKLLAVRVEKFVTGVHISRTAEDRREGLGRLVSHGAAATEG